MPVVSFARRDLLSTRGGMTVINRARGAIIVLRGPQFLEGRGTVLGSSILFPGIRVLDCDTYRGRWQPNNVGA